MSFCVWLELDYLKIDRMMMVRSISYPMVHYIISVHYIIVTLPYGTLHHLLPYGTLHHRHTLAVCCMNPYFTVETSERGTRWDHTFLDFQGEDSLPRESTV